MSKPTNTTLKSILLVVGLYVVTLLCTAVSSIVTLAALAPQTCSDYGDALLILWGVIALLLALSTAVVGVWAWKTISSIGGRLAVLIGYALLMLATFGICAFGLLIAFNC